jgi:hypothetical protein
MKKVAFALAAGLALVAAGSTYAQQPRSTKRADKAAPPLEEVTSMAQMTPEMWFYQQESRRYDDPKQAVRRKAEFKAAQRERRIAAMQWYGYSNARPTANASLFTGSYSPGWGSNSRSDPFLWRGGAYYNARTYNAAYGLW